MAKFTEFVLEHATPVWFADVGCAANCGQVSRVRECSAGLLMELPGRCCRLVYVANAVSGKVMRGLGSMPWKPDETLPEIIAGQIIVFVRPV
jgi:hypothetical protein